MTLSKQQIEVFCYENDLVYMFQSKRGFHFKEEGDNNNQYILKECDINV